MFTKNLSTPKILAKTSPPTEKQTGDIFKKVVGIFEEISIEEIACLLKADGDHLLLNEIFSAARKLRDAVLGRVIYMPVPLYVGNSCLNNCSYCAFRISNRQIDRKTLSDQELTEKVAELIADGFRIIELVYSAAPLYSVNTVARHARLTKDLLERAGGGQVALNTAPFNSAADYRALREAGTDIIIQWMETGDEERYKLVHPGFGRLPSTPKSDFKNRLAAYDLMLKGRMENIGIGVLFGLANWQSDVLYVIQHARYLQKEYGIAPIIGIPRLKPAADAPYFTDVTYKADQYSVNDEQLKLAVAVYRLALPYCHIFISTREQPNLMFELLNDCGGGNVFASKCSVEVGADHTPGHKTTSNSAGQYGQFEVYSLSSRETCDKLTELNYLVGFLPPLKNKI